MVPQKRPPDSLTHCRWRESSSSAIQGLDTGKGAKAAPRPVGTCEGQPEPAVWPGGSVRCAQPSHAQRDAAPAPTVDRDGGGLGMFRMIDQDGFAISLPRAINLKMVLSLFDFHRKKRLFLKWIVTAKFRDNRLAMTRLHFLEQTTETFPSWVWRDSLSYIYGHDAGGCCPPPQLAPLPSEFMLLGRLMQQGRGAWGLEAREMGVSTQERQVPWPCRSPTTPSTCEGKKASCEKEGCSTK